MIFQGFTLDGLYDTQVIKYLFGSEAQTCHGGLTDL